MPKYLSRLIVILLIPCLITDSVLGSIDSIRTVPNNLSLQFPFASQALANPLDEAFKAGPTSGLWREEGRVGASGNAGKQRRLTEIPKAEARVPRIRTKSHYPARVWSENFVRKFDEAYARRLAMMALRNRRQVEIWMADFLQTKEDWVYLAETAYLDFVDRIDRRLALSRELNWLLNHMRNWPWLGKAGAVHFEEMSPVRTLLIPVGQRWVLHAHFGFEDKSKKLHEFNGLLIFLGQKGGRIIAEKVAAEMKISTLFFDLENVPLAKGNRVRLDEQIQGFLDAHQEKLVAAMQEPVPNKPLRLYRGRIGHDLTDLYEIAEEGYDDTLGGGLEFLEPAESWEDATSPARVKPTRTVDQHRRSGEPAAPAPTKGSAGMPDIGRNHRLEWPFDPEGDRDRGGLSEKPPADRLTGGDALDWSTKIGGFAGQKRIIVPAVFALLARERRAMTIAEIVHILRENSWPQEKLESLVDVGLETLERDLRLIACSSSSDHVKSFLYRLRIEVENVAGMIHPILMELAAVGMNDQAIRMIRDRIRSFVVLLDLPETLDRGPGYLTEPVFANVTWIEANAIKQVSVLRALSRVQYSEPLQGMIERIQEEVSPYSPEQLRAEAREMLGIGSGRDNAVRGYLGVRDLLADRSSCLLRDPDDWELDERPVISNLYRNRIRFWEIIARLSQIDPLIDEKPGAIYDWLTKSTVSAVVTPPEGGSRNAPPLGLQKRDLEAA